MISADLIETGYQPGATIDQALVLPEGLEGLVDQVYREKATGEGAVTIWADRPVEIDPETDELRVSPGTRVFVPRDPNQLFATIPIGPLFDELDVELGGQTHVAPAYDRIEPPSPPPERPQTEHAQEASSLSFLVLPILDGLSHLSPGNKNARRLVNLVVAASLVASCGAHRLDTLPIPAPTGPAYGDVLVDPALFETSDEGRLTDVFASLNVGLTPRYDDNNHYLSNVFRIEGDSEYQALRVAELLDVKGQPIDAFLIQDTSGNIRTDFVAWLAPEGPEQGRYVELTGYNVDVTPISGGQGLRLEEENGAYVPFGTLTADRVNKTLSMAITLPDGNNITIEDAVAAFGASILNLDPQLGDAMAAPEPETLPTETPVPPDSNIWSASFASDDTLRASLPEADAKRLVAIGIITIRPPAAEGDQGYGAVPIAVVEGSRLVAVSADGMATSVDNNLAWIVDGADGKKQLLELIPSSVFSPEVRAKLQEFIPSLGENDQLIAWYHPDMPDRPLYVMHEGQLMMVISQDNTITNAQLVPVEMEQRFRVDRTAFNMTELQRDLEGLSTEALTNEVDVGGIMVRSQFSRMLPYTEVQFESSTLGEVYYYILGRFGLRRYLEGATQDYPEYKGLNTRQLIEDPRSLADIARKRLKEGRIYTTDLFGTKEDSTTYNFEGIIPQSDIREITIATVTKAEFNALKQMVTGGGVQYLAINRQPSAFQIKLENGTVVDQVINDNDNEWLVFADKGQVVIIHHNDIQGPSEIGLAYIPREEMTDKKGRVVLAYLATAWGIQPLEPLKPELSVGWGEIYSDFALYDKINTLVAR